MADPSPTDRAQIPPAVLAPITLLEADGSAVVLESIAAAAAGATGVDLSIPDPQLALGQGLAVADRVAEAAGLRVFVRADVPLSSGSHARICPPVVPSARVRSIAPCVVDLGIDRLGLPADAGALASCWPSGDGPEPAPPFMISTIGFDSPVDAQVMALATLATMRGASAITTNQLRIVRRVVDTIAAVIAAERTR